MLRLKVLVFLIGILSLCGIISAQNRSEITYKQIDTTQLKMFVYKPDKINTLTGNIAMVFFFGGGWTHGSTKQFEPFAEYYASKGFVSILVDYRIKSRQGTTPFESLKDAKSAIRYLRMNAKALNIDPDRMIVSGGSAGGQLAAACFIDNSINEKGDDLKISTKPNALVLFNPVIDNSEHGYGFERVKEKWQEFSPLHNIVKGFPPTIFFLGTKDDLIPVETARLFKQKIESVGGRCDLFLYDNQKHGFFNKIEFRPDIISKIDDFLKSIGYLQ